MPKTDGELTKKRIIHAAEQLFSQKGFEGTSVAEIARQAEVNKALIYYYFKDKNDLIISLFKSIIEELEELAEQSTEATSTLTDAAKARHKLESEVRYLAGRKQIIAVMLMEALKSDNTEDFFFRSAENVILHDVGDPPQTDDEARARFWANEFFMGFIPLISFVVFRDKWCAYFNCDPDKALDYFLESFEHSHLLLPGVVPVPRRKNENP